jgi:hypothetical protein
MSLELLGNKKEGLIISFKNKLLMNDGDGNGDNKNTNNIPYYKLPEKGLYKVFMDKKQFVKTIHKDDSLFFHDDDDKGFDKDLLKKANEYSKKFNDSINIMIDKWNKHNDTFIELYGIDYFEKYHYCPSSLEESSSSNSISFDFYTDDDSIGSDFSLYDYYYDEMED